MSGSMCNTTQLTTNLGSIQSSKTNPAFLHSNSTSHEWVLGAFAELIDNAYDPDVAASQMYIDVSYKDKEPYITFSDNGSGMSDEQLYRMLSFGFSCKPSTPGWKHQPIGRYGNGFKSGSMRIGRDALVLTSKGLAFTCGLLSQTYLKSIGADTVLVPITSWKLTRKKGALANIAHNSDNADALAAILKHSLFRSLEELRSEMEEMQESNHSTRVYIYNLRRNAYNKQLELDFDNDPSDIRFLEHIEYGVNQQQVRDHEPEHRKSLRAYCSILYLKPRMQIFIRDNKVRTKIIAKCLSHTEIDKYQPRFLNQSIKIVFGFNNNKTDYGLMMYHRNRLIEAFVRVGYQKQANILGVGVIGVVETNFLEVSHNKQSFSNDARYQSTVKTLGQKLNDYWDEKKNSGIVGDGNSIDVEDDNRTAPDWTWVQCDNPQCLKWRRLPENYRPDALPDKWFCYMNPDPKRNTCQIEEEPEDSNISAPYQKLYKKQSMLLEKMKVQDAVLREQERKLELLQKHEQIRQRVLAKEPPSTSTSSTPEPSSLIKRGPSFFEQAGPLEKVRRRDLSETSGAPRNTAGRWKPQPVISAHKETISRPSFNAPTTPLRSRPSSIHPRPFNFPAPEMPGPSASVKSTPASVRQDVEEDLLVVDETGNNQVLDAENAETKRVCEEVAWIRPAGEEEEAVIVLDSDDDDGGVVTVNNNHRVKMEEEVSVVDSDVKMKLVSQEQLDKLTAASRQAEDAIMLLEVTEKQLNVCRKKLKEARLYVLGLRHDTNGVGVKMRQCINRLLKILS